MTIVADGVDGDIARVMQCNYRCNVLTTHMLTVLPAMIYLT